MTVQEFLQDLLASQDLEPAQEKLLKEHKKEVTDFLRAEFGDDPVIKYAGSYEKGTLIRERYDLDIVCYFPSTDSRTLKEIYDDVANHLREKYIVEEKASAIRITGMKGADSSNGYHIDVVPGRFIEGTKDVFLHVTYGEKERMQTNLKTHIEHITGSGCIETIRLAKLWAQRNNLEIKTFILELFVVQSLSGYRHKANLQSAFVEVLDKFKSDFQTVQLVDPANSANVVSKSLHSSARLMVAQAAEAAWEKIAHSNEVMDWQSVFGEETVRQSGSASAYSAGPTVIRNPSGQWAE